MPCCLPGWSLICLSISQSVDDKGVAAGQVKELGCDGRMLIEWVDGTHSHCYPQELFLMGDEVGVRAMGKSTYGI